MTIDALFRLDGKTALVTGSSRGLGRSMALALAGAGADIILTGRSEKTLIDTVGKIKALGRKAVSVTVDMRKPENCEAGFRHCLARHGPIHILINNIGNRINADSVEEQSLEDWTDSLHFNATSCFLGTKIIGGAMLERGEGGRIINIASMNAFVSNQGIGGRGYEASKAAIVQFTRAVAADWAAQGVTVNAICPGLFMTDKNREWNQKKPEVIETLVRGIPMRRPGKPEEIGPLAVFLASDASSYMTGAALVIDGGYTLW